MQSWLPAGWAARSALHGPLAMHPSSETPLATENCAHGCVAGGAPDGRGCHAASADGSRGRSGLLVQAVSSAHQGAEPYRHAGFVCMLCDSAFAALLQSGMRTCAHPFIAANAVGKAVLVPLPILYSRLMSRQFPRPAPGGK